MEKIVFKRYESPAGPLIIGSCGEALCMCDWEHSNRRGSNVGRLSRYFGAEPVEGSSAVITEAIGQLEEYFSGKRNSFTVPLKLGGTPFQCRVWEALMKIPYGSVASYGDVAREIGAPRAVRAVAGAIAANAVSVIVPCHRVVGSGGSLTGYAGGLKAKAYLLALESD